MSHAWLQRKRKGELIDLAQKAGVPDVDSLLKDDIVNALEVRLNTNESRYAKHPEFRDFYGRTGSPIKRERFSPSEALSAIKPRRRTLVKAPFEEPEPEQPMSTRELVTQTPREVSRRVSQRVSQVVSDVDFFPASPAQLAEVADQSFQVAKQSANELWDRTQIDYFKEVIRENASSVAAIQALILFIEAAGLQLSTLQWMPTFPLGQTLSDYTRSESLFVPDFLALLSSDWWAPATLWSLTSWVLPLVFSYFFNLTLRSNTNRKTTERQYPTDPLTFFIMKAILAYSAYRIPIADSAFVATPGYVEGLASKWGPFSAETVGVVRNNVPGGYHGLQIGAVVGILVSLYDAALKK